MANRIISLVTPFRIGPPKGWQLWSAHARVCKLDFGESRYLLSANMIISSSIGLTQYWQGWAWTGLHLHGPIFLFLSWIIPIFDAAWRTNIISLLGFHLNAMFGAVGFWSLSVWGSLVFTCCGYVNFIYPSIRDNNLTFNDIDVVYFTWVSSVDEPWMNLWCAPNSSVPQSKDYGKSYRQHHPRSQYRHSTMKSRRKNRWRGLTCNATQQYTTDKSQPTAATLNPSPTPTTINTVSATCKWRASPATMVRTHPSSASHPRPAWAQKCGDSTPLVLPVEAQTLVSCRN